MLHHRHALLYHGALVLEKIGDKNDLGPAIAVHDDSHLRPLPESVV